MNPKDKESRDEKTKKSEKERKFENACAYLFLENFFPQNKNHWAEDSLDERLKNFLELPPPQTEASRARVERALRAAILLFLSRESDER